MVDLEDVPVAAVERAPEQRRALKLVADELRPLRDDDQEPDEVVDRGDERPAAQQRLTEHRGPLDLEHIARPTGNLPDDIEVIDVVWTRPAHARRAEAQFARIEPGTQRTAMRLANLLA